MPALEICHQGSQRKGTLQKYAAPSCDRILETQIRQKADANLNKN